VSERATARPIYLDHHATTPIDPRVLEVMLPYFTQEFGNASSKDHIFGARASDAVDTARQQIAGLIGAREAEIVFTSGATESNNTALLGVMESYADRGDHLITCVTEHKAILDTATRLEHLGKRVTYLPVDRFGSIDLDLLRSSITEKTILVSIMAANNEIGTLAPLVEIGKITRERGILFHTDATQAVGNIAINVERMYIDLLSLSSHKIYGPKGVGALYVRRRNPRVLMTPLMWGGGHERGLRSGTLNVPGIAGLGHAAKLAQLLMPKESERLRGLRDQLFAGIKERVPAIEINGHPSDRLPHNLSIFVPSVEAKGLVVATPDIAFSTGAACTSERVEPSHVLLAIHPDQARAHQSIRFGLGRSTTLDEINYTVVRLSDEIFHAHRLRA